jgi:hypothetical protein
VLTQLLARVVDRHDTVQASKSTLLAQQEKQQQQRQERLVALKEQVFSLLGKIDFNDPVPMEKLDQLVLAVSCSSDEQAIDGLLASFRQWSERGKSLMSWLDYFHRVFVPR